MPNPQTTETPGLSDALRSRRKAITIEELSDFLSVSPKTLYAIASKGRIPVIRIGSSLRFDPKLTADWLEARSIV